LRCRNLRQWTLSRAKLIGPGEAAEKFPPLDKIIVAVAGPVFSLLLAVFFAGIVWAVGHPVSEGDSTTVVGYVMPGSPAEKAGLRPVDKILSVDGKPVRRFMGMNDSISWDVVRSEGDKIEVKFQRDGKVQTVSVEPYKAETRGWRRKSVRAAAHLPGRNPDHRKGRIKKPCSGSGTASPETSSVGLTNTHLQSDRVAGIHQQTSK